MGNYRKIVDKFQLTLTPQNKSDIAAGKAVTFQGFPVIKNGSAYLCHYNNQNNRLTLLENDVLIIHPEGNAEVVKPSDFSAKYVPIGS